MSPRDPQVPALTVAGAGQTARAGPPSAGTTFKYPPAKNATDWLSGDQNGADAIAPSVPGSGRAAAAPLSRIQIWFWPFSVTRNAVMRPSGEIAKSITGLSR